jgi:CheY-like chemotaxis protein
MELDGTTVLVVEDDDDTREVMRAMLELCGATVLVADSAKSGLDTFMKSRPDAIVSDIAMPGEDGYWLVREVARRLNAPNVPAVAVTAFAGQHPRTKALEAGFRAHLAKPVDPEVLCRAVVEVMEAG